MRSNRSRWRGRHPVALTCALVAIGAFAFASPASASEEEPFTLGIAIAGTGFGEVECEYKEGEAKVVEAPCEELEFPGKKAVKLIPVAEEDSEFVRFEAAEGSAASCEGKTKACSFVLGEGGFHESFIEARFDEITPSFAASVAGEGEVSCLVEGFPEGCEMQENYEFATQISVVPEPAEGWEFAGFRNGSGSASACVSLTKLCTFILEKNSAVEALFAPIMRQLTISKLGSGQGSVTCDGTACASSYAQGTEVTLAAAPASGSTFAGWSLGGCPGTGPCKIAIEADTTVAATFQADSKPPPPPPGGGEGEAWAAAIARVKAGKAWVKLGCSGGPCGGTLRLTAKVLLGGKRKSVLVGKAPFALADGATQTLKVKLSAPALRELGKSRSLRAQAGGKGVLAGTVKLK